MIYSDKVMDHFNHPRNVGEIEGADAIGQVGNPVCGDIMKMYLKIDGDVITDVKFKTFGCGSAIATSPTAARVCCACGWRILSSLRMSHPHIVWLHRTKPSKSKLPECVSHSGSFWIRRVREPFVSPGFLSQN